MEQAIAQAKLAKCKIYIVGREAVFGYPFAHRRWVHPQTNHIHWLPTDRGPETAFISALQTDGLRRRFDSLGAGFGPYEQARMTRETGGALFVLPSRAAFRRERPYRLENIQDYQPRPPCPSRDCSGPS